MSIIGYPTGPAQIMTPELITHYNNPDNLPSLCEESEDQRSLYVTVRLWKEADFIPQDFPLVGSYENSAIQYHNEATEGQYCLDYISLRDLVEF